MFWCEINYEITCNLKEVSTKIKSTKVCEKSGQISLTMNNVIIHSHCLFLCTERHHCYQYLIPFIAGNI